jgi:hypothetical protein
MGIYECIWNCGNGNYCVSCCTTLDNDNTPWWLKICKAHELVVGNTYTYSLCKFIKRYSAGLSTFMDDCVKATLLETKKNSKGLTLVKLNVTMFDLKQLSSSKIMYFSEFDDAPSWKILPDGTVELIDVFVQENFVRVMCHNENIYWNYEKRDICNISDLHHDNYAYADMIG